MEEQQPANKQKLLKILGNHFFLLSTEPLGGELPNYLLKKPLTLCSRSRSPKREQDLYISDRSTVQTKNINKF